jgi:integrase
MLGGIYSDQRCSVCGSRLKDNRKNGLVCPNHPDQGATRFRVYFKGVTRRFGGYAEASRFLTGLRFKTDEDTFDPRAYKRDNPLGFENLALQWLGIKKEEVKKSSFKKINSHISKAIDAWGNRSVKEIKPKDLQLFLISLNLSDKSKHNHLSSIHQFFKWLWENEEIERIPKFPKVSFELAWRKTVDKETQQGIIDEVYRISERINVKIWIGIKWLSTYFNLRPGELLNIKEGDIDLKQGEIIIPHPKEKRPKKVFLLDEDIELIKGLPRGLPGLYFFRHVKGVSGVQAGRQFGEKYLYKWWKKACGNLGIEGVDLYGGTRHSTVRALRKYRTPEQIKLASMHSTNKAFERYFQIKPDDLRNIYRDTSIANLKNNSTRKLEG